MQRNGAGADLYDDMVWIGFIYGLSNDNKSGATRPCCQEEEVKIRLISMEITLLG